MRAVISDNTGPKGLQIREVPDPQFSDWEVRVRVRAVALNRADLAQTYGKYPPPPGAPQDIPGLEYAGEVEAVGAKVRRWKAGDRVMGLVGGGAFAEQVVAHEREVIPMPSGFSFTDAAALPEVFITAFDAMVLQGNLRSGENLLVHAAGSGVGTAAAQLGRAFGATVIGTARTQEKLDRAAPWGLHRGIVVGTPPVFADEVKKLTGGAGVDVVMDLVGGAYVPESVRAAARQARLILIGLVAGDAAELELDVILTKRLRIQGTVLRSRPVEEKIALAQVFEKQLVPLFERQVLRPVLDSVLPINEIQAGFARMRDNATVGKVVLTWG